ncbi:MAG: hypothetical protein KGO02_25310, partial [Alphaproteobacteria bacterium]|nr:hypothetical protein [Alphaproteobacteria bacterium]
DYRSRPEEGQCKTFTQARASHGRSQAHDEVYRKRAPGILRDDMVTAAPMPSHSQMEIALVRTTSEFRIPPEFAI